ncbi:MAG: hypothetical protein P8X74_03915 [Reinekea sp.]
MACALRRYEVTDSGFLMRWICTLSKASRAGRSRLRSATEHPKGLALIG